MLTGGSEDVCECEKPGSSDIKSMVKVYVLSYSTEVISSEAICIQLMFSEIVTSGVIWRCVIWGEVIISIEVTWNEASLSEATSCDLISSRVTLSQLLTEIDEVEMI